MQIRILAFFLLLVSALAVPANTSAQMCHSTGNVELTITPENNNSPWVNFAFVNSNDYAVTIQAAITLRDTGGNEKKLSRTIVVNPGTTKDLRFASSNVGMGNLAPYDCSCIFFPSKCD